MGDKFEAKPEGQPQTSPQTVDQHQPGTGGAPVAAERVTPLQSLLDVGEQVYGSSHAFEIAAPWNLGPGPATVTIELPESPAFSVEAFPAMLNEANARMTSASVEQQLQSSIRVRFSPVADGEYPPRFFSVDLTVKLRWADGTLERKTIRLRGRARRLEDRPEQAVDREATANIASSVGSAAQGAEKPFKESDRTSLDHAYNAAIIEAGSIAISQDHGVTSAKDEAGSYVPPPVKRSVWWDIAEGAIMLGTGVVAGTIGKLLAETVVTGIAGTTSKPVVDALAGAMKDGMKKGAKTAVHRLSSDSSYDVSSDKKIAFFEMQQDVLTTVATSNEQVVNDRHAELTPLLGSQPDVAIGAMNAIATVLKGQQPAAKDAQKMHTAAAWVGFRARMSLGAETLATAEHEQVTELAKARPAHPQTDMSSLKGLLDLDVDIEHGAPYVASARINGVARALANELIGNPLAPYRIPLRLVVSRNEMEPTIITRDEAGRVRVTGNLERLARFGHDSPLRDEAQAELAARRLVDEILDRPFVPKTGKVDTDDAGKDS